MHLSYQYSEKDNTESISYKYKKKTSNKKNEELARRMAKKNNRVKKRYQMEVLYKVFEVLIVIYFIYMLIKFLKCRFGKCDLD